MLLRLIWGSVTPLCMNYKKGDSYYKLSQKVITNCSTYYKVQQVLQSVTENYCKV